jgi:hypothetical protein
MCALRCLGKYRRGFSLIEAAVVLGVVGLVIGGIWAAAVTVKENLEVNQILESVEGIRARAVTHTDILRTLGSGNIGVNASYFEGVAGGCKLVTASNRFECPRGVLINNFAVENTVNSFLLIRIIITGLPRGHCIKMAMRATSVGTAAYFLFRIRATDNSIVNGDSFPIPITAAESACSSATASSLTFYYRI